MNIPNLDIQATYPSAMVGVISLTPPYNWCDIEIRCDEHVKTFVGRITYEDQPYGKDKGLQFAYGTDLSANIFHRVNSDQAHSLISNTTLIQGDGTYRIGLYVQNDEDVWNEYFIFLTTEKDGTHLVFTDKNSKELNVLDKGVI